MFFYKITTYNFTSNVILAFITHLFCAPLKLFTGGLGLYFSQECIVFSKRDALPAMCGSQDKKRENLDIFNSFHAQLRFFHDTFERQVQA